MYFQPHFDFRDVLQAPARALSAKQILVMTLSLCAGLVVFDIFTYLAYIVDGQPFGVVFGAFGLLPIGRPAVNADAAWVVFWVGVALTVLVVMMGLTAVSVINVELVRGNRFMSWTKAARFALARFKQLFLAELSIILFVVFIVGLFALLGLVSRIPYIGEWIYTVLFVIPNFIIALFAVFIIFVFILTFLLMPAVAAAERHGEVFGVILETFSTIIRQPFRWLGYTVYSLVAAKVCSFVYAYFAFRAVQFMTGASMLGGGNALNRLVKSGLSHLPASSEFAREIFNIFPGIDFGFSLAYWSYPRTSDPAGHLMSVMIFLVFASIIGYALAIVAAAQAHGFVVIRRQKDDYNVADEEPMFFTDEHVNPEIKVAGDEGQESSEAT